MIVGSGSAVGANTRARRFAALITPQKWASCAKCKYASVRTRSILTTSIREVASVSGVMWRIVTSSTIARTQFELRCRHHLPPIPAFVTQTATRIRWPHAIPTVTLLEPQFAAGSLRQRHLPRAVFDIFNNFSPLSFTPSSPTRPVSSRTKPTSWQVCSRATWRPGNF